jgi:ABC-type glycerol-3-phosphate transport system substrate-binding protein
MKFLLSHEIQAQLGGTGVTGPFPVVNGIEVIDPIKFQALEVFRGSIALPVLPEMNVYWNPMNSALEQFMDNNISPGEALTQAEAEIISLVAELRESRGN